MESQIFRDINTELDLNGPYLAFSTHPSDQTADNGDSISYTGIATNSYGISGTPENIGTLSYQWYETGVGALTDGGVISGATTNVLTFSSVVSGTDDNRTFYLQAEFTPAQVDYESGHAVEDPVNSNTVGMTITPDIEIVAQPVTAHARTNENQTFTVDAKLSNGSTQGLIYQWYVDGVAETNRTKSVTITGSTTSSSPFSYATSSDASYSIPTTASNLKVTLAGAAGGRGGTDSPWGNTEGFGQVGRVGDFNLNTPHFLGKTLTFRIGGKGGDGSHGQGTGVTGPAGTVSGGGGNPSVGIKFDVRDNAGASNWIDIGPHTFDGQSNYSVTHTYASNTAFNVNARSSCGGAWLRVGPPSRINLDDCKPGGDNDYNDQQITASTGTFSNANGSSAIFTVGGAGQDGAGSGTAGGAAGYRGGSGGGGGGGASSFLVVDGNYTIVAGGGGGGGGGSWNTPRRNATPAGTPGEAGYFLPYPGPVPLSSGYITVDWGHYSGGDGGGGGGGGGGSPGGASGNRGWDKHSSAYNGWGGGSRYDDPKADLTSQGNNAGNGYAALSFDSTTTIATSETRNTYISGVNTPTLTIKSDWNGTQSIKCRVSHANVTNSPVDSDTVTFAMVPGLGSQNLIVESIENTSTAQVNTIDLSNGDYEMSTSSNLANQAGQTNVISLYAPNQDLKVQMDLYGGKGEDSLYGSVGGEGGYSRIEFTMQQNQEYVVAGLSTFVNAPFVYAGANLIAVVGGGGGAGGSTASLDNAGKDLGADGGDGGGVNISGEDGAGGGGGGGNKSGVLNEIQTTFMEPLSSNKGVFGGSYVSPFLYAEDRNAEHLEHNGRTLICTKGIYWAQQGKSPCQSLGTTKFRLGNGTEVSNTASITRGYKAGYNIIQTAGGSLGLIGGRQSGKGGSGATGGSGGKTSNSGGGGSGYADANVVTVKDSRIGGSTGNAKVVVRVVV